MLQFFKIIIIILAAGLSSVVTLAAENETRRLPATLTLSYALSLADEPHPSLLISEANIKNAEAEQLEVDAENDVSAYLEARLRYIEPSSVAIDQNNNDRRLGLIINKDIYDFGRLDAKRKSAQARLSGSRNAFLDVRARRRLEIAQRYFDVLLADIVFLRYNEEMAIEFILLDRLRARKELGRSSDLQIAEQAQYYQRARFMRTNAQNEQRRTRALLAEVLNHPGQLPNELAEPNLGTLDRELSDYEVLLKLAFENNFHIKSLQDMASSAQSDVAAARASDNPRVSGHIEAYDYSRDFGSSDEFRAGITLQVPIYDGNRNDSYIARAKAKLYKARAILQQAKSNLRQSVLETWLELGALRIKRDQVAAIQDYRELDLDYRRALYEMEVKADLGKGMALITEAQFLVKQTDFKMALAWIRMDILTGQLKLDSQ